MQDRSFIPRHAWNQASDDDKKQYEQLVTRKLNNIDVPYSLMTCDASHCHCERSTIDKFAKNIIDSCIEAANESISLTSRPKHSGIPGWNEHVKEVEQKSKFWHALWCEVGRPRDGAVAAAMKSARRRYHYAIRFVKKNETEVRNCNMAKALSRCSDRDFHKEIKTVLGNHSRVAATIDGASNSEDIANTFGDQYKELYNSVGYSKDDLDSLLNNIHQQTTLQTWDQFTVGEVQEGIRSLKPGKYDGDIGLCSDHVLNGGIKLCVYLCILFNIMCKHSHVPQCILLATITPIPKPGLSNSISSNYRGIALASCLGKIVDKIILMKYTAKLQTSELQFGFKKGASTDLCSWVFKETINYYVNEGTNVYSVLIDASKAFDKVNFCKHFQKLVQRGLPKEILLLLINLYTRQIIRVQWNGAYSQQFTVSNGVRQGAVLSPILYSIYVDGLLKKLTDSGVGCYIGKVFLGALAYADDLTILAPSAEACRKLLKICELYAIEHDISFNPNKSQLIIFGSKPKAMNTIYLCGQPIPEVGSVKHLGHIINNNLDDSPDILAKRAAFIGQANFIISTFKYLTPMFLHKIFTVYCMSFFGSQLWKLEVKSLDPLVKSYNIALRKLFQLPYNSHRSVLYYLSGGSSPFDIIASRTKSFLDRCFTSPNKLISNLALQCKYLSSSTIGYNFTVLSQNAGCSNEGNFNHINHLCLELLECRDGFSYNGLNKYENNILLNYMSSS